MSITTVLVERILGVEISVVTVKMVAGRNGRGNDINIIRCDSELWRFN